ncbi:MAG: prepilin-type N-terminal cleavage/methylation domain-containing protein [Armatimonadota bacterium]
MRVRGLTLVELMVAIVITALIAASAGQATYVAVRHNASAKAYRTVATRDQQFEDRLRTLISAACLSTVTTDPASYYLGGDAAGDTDQSITTSGAGLVFTALSEKLPAEYVNSQDDFETLNQTYGPRGGLCEISISQSAIGNAPVSTGLFLRRQTPADGDSSQGGFESSLDSDIESISFEFYNGESWDLSWDSTAMDVPRLPSAVRVTYSRTSDSKEHVFIVRLPLSDVTPDNPVTAGSSTQ